MYDKNERYFSSTESESGNTARRISEDDRRSRKVWVLGGLAVAALACAAWFTYPLVVEHKQMFSRLPGVEASVTALSGQLQQAEAKWSDWSSRQQQQIHDSVSQAQKKTDAEIRNERNHADAMNATLYQRVTDETRPQFQGMNTRLAELETDRDSSRAEVAKLRQDLASARERMNDQARELSALHGSVDTAAVENQRQLAGLGRQLERHQRDLETLNRRTEMERVDFEATKNHTRQITPEIALNITSTDVSHRRFSGYLWVLPEARAIWFKNQSVQTPMVFNRYQDGARRELVVVNMTRDAATGYLLISQDTSASVAADRGLKGAVQ